jgi:hypothetical protein
MLDAWVSKMKNVFAAVKQQPTVKTEDTEVREGRMFVKDGKIYVSQKGKAVPYSTKKTKVKGKSVEECAKEYGLPPKLMRQVFTPFDISPVQELWKKALYTLAPEIDEYDLESTERRNIDMGLRQLEEAWVHPETIYASATEAVKEYDEVFRTPGEQKKAARELGEIYDDIMNDL